MGDEADDLDAALHEDRNDLLGVACADRADRHLELNAHARALFNDVAFHDQIHCEGLIGDRTCDLDLLFDPLAIVKRRGDHAESTRFTYGRSEFTIGNMRHRTLDDGVFDSEHIAKFCFHTSSFIEALNSSSDYIALVQNEVLNLSGYFRSFYSWRLYLYYWSCFRMFDITVKKRR